SWASITSATSSTSSATVSYAATANTSGAARSATLTIGGQLVTVQQAAIDHVTLTPGASTVTILGTQAVAATAYDVNNAVLPNIAFSFTSSNPNIAAIAATNDSAATATTQRTGTVT